MPRLRDEDRLAVDLLLDRAASGNGRTGFTPVNAGAQGQLAKVQSVLKVLDMLPADEPPADLVARTLRRLDAESAHDPSALRLPQPAAASMQMPHA